MHGFQMPATSTAMLHSGCAHLIDKASFTKLATYGASGSTGSFRTDDHQWSRKTTARHALSQPESAFTALGASRMTSR